jgi:uncharacterized protein YjbJ (UPF0337 family)|tara:strand:+ start:379 stop:570 length:192 start_codon:yes stop_codon:yes gene_type:complete
MSDKEDKLKGKINEIAGKGKQGVGKAIDNEDLKAEGDLQETKGKAQSLKGEAKEKVKKGVDNA